MPKTNFRFTADDPFVIRYLTRAERDDDSIRWQQNDDYTLEFHDGHSTGHPIYFRIDGNKDKSNLPKIDTRNNTASSYFPKNQSSVNVTALKNGNKLAKLSGAGQRDIEAIIGTSWTTLALLASRVWTNTFAPVDDDDDDDDASEERKACVKTPGCAGTVQVVQSGKAPCDTCYAYQ